MIIVKVVRKNIVLGAVAAKMVQAALIELPVMNGTPRQPSLNMVRLAMLVAIINAAEVRKK